MIYRKAISIESIGMLVKTVRTILFHSLEHSSTLFSC